MMKTLGNIWLILSLKCEHSSRLVSEGFDRELTRSERIALRTHHWICRSCRGFRKQMELLHQLSQIRLSSEQAKPRLDEAARAKILGAIRSAGSKDLPD